MINRKQLYTIGNQKVNKMRHFTVIADLNVQKKSSVVTYLFFLLIFIPVYVSFIIVKTVVL